MVYILYLIKQASQKTQQLLISVICNSCRGSEKKGALCWRKQRVVMQSLLGDKSRGMYFSYANRDVVELLIATLMWVSLIMTQFKNRNCRTNCFLLVYFKRTKDRVNNKKARTVISELWKRLYQMNAPSSKVHYITLSVRRTTYLKKLA